MANRFFPRTLPRTSGTRAISGHFDDPMYPSKRPSQRSSSPTRTSPSASSRKPVAMDDSIDDLALRPASPIKRSPSPKPSSRKQSASPKTSPKSGKQNRTDEDEDDSLNQIFAQSSSPKKSSSSPKTNTSRKQTSGSQEREPHMTGLYNIPTQSSKKPTKTLPPASFTAPLNPESTVQKSKKSNPRQKSNPAPNKSNPRQKAPSSTVQRFQYGPEKFAQIFQNHFPGQPVPRQTFELDKDLWKLEMKKAQKKTSAQRQRSAEKRPSVTEQNQKLKEYLSGSKFHAGKIKTMYRKVHQDIYKHEDNVQVPKEVIDGIQALLSLRCGQIAKLMTTLWPVDDVNIKKDDSKVKPYIINEERINVVLGFLPNLHR